MQRRSNARAKESPGVRGPPRAWDARLEEGGVQSPERGDKPPHPEIARIPHHPIHVYFRIGKSDYPFAIH
jgi:hypothetical protein